MIVSDLVQEAEQSIIEEVEIISKLSAVASQNPYYKYVPAVCWIDSVLSE